MTLRVLCGIALVASAAAEGHDGHDLQDAAGADVEPCAEIKFRGASPLAAES